jgi:hypothetical protein
MGAVSGWGPASARLRGERGEPGRAAGSGYVMLARPGPPAFREPRKSISRRAAEAQRRAAQFSASLRLRVRPICKTLRCGAPVSCFSACGRAVSESRRPPRRRPRAGPMRPVSGADQSTDPRRSARLAAWAEPRARSPRWSPRRCRILSRAGLATRQPAPVGVTLLEGTPLLRLDLPGQLTQPVNLPVGSTDLPR